MGFISSTPSGRPESLIGKSRASEEGGWFVADGVGLWPSGYRWAGYVPARVASCIKLYGKFGFRALSSVEAKGDEFTSMLRTPDGICIGT